MRVLIGMSGWQETLQLEDCCGIRHTQAYNIARQLASRGVEIVYCDIGSPYLSEDESETYYAHLDIPPADHALIVEPIAFSQRTFGREWSQCYPDRGLPRRKVGRCPLLDSLRKKVPGCLSTIGNSQCHGVGMEDIFFYEFTYGVDAAKRPIRAPQHGVKIGWAADATIFQPHQEPQPLRILLDHPHYVSHEPDDTDLLVQSLADIPATICRFGESGEEKIDPANYTPTTRYGARMPQPTLAEIHGKAHIFCVTHKESQGLSVLEAAMAGNLIVAKTGHIKPVLLDDLAHVTYEEQPDWDAIISQVNPARSRRLALPYDRWDDIGQIIYATFTSWSKA